MIDKLKELLGEDSVADASELCFKYSVAGKMPSLVLFPTSTDQVATILKLARKDSKKIMTCGNNSQYQFGSNFESLDWCIALNRMNRILQHEAADLIVTVEPGATLSHLQKFLKTHKQFLALDSLNFEKRTLGGIVATNSSGPLRMQFGTCRDLVLGMKVVLPDGTIIRAGGKTVKNVAGYDLSKLFIGSMGTLGVIAEVTFKLSPLPVERKTLWAEFRQFNEIPDLVQSICSSNLVISRCEYLNSFFVEKNMDNDFKSKEPHNILFTVLGNSEMVSTTVETLQQKISEKAGKIFRCFCGDEDDKLWENILNTNNKNFQFACHSQLSVPKASFGNAIDFLKNFELENNISIAIQSYAGNGIIHLSWGESSQGQQLNKDRFESQVKQLRQIAEDFQGNLVVLQSPDPLRGHELVWGKPARDFALSRAIKRKSDFHQVLATGRFIGGL